MINLDAIPDLDKIDIYQMQGSLLPDGEAGIRTHEIEKLKQRLEQIKGSAWFMKVEEA